MTFTPISSNFNPRSPWGERLSRLRFLMSGSVFQSTLPVGGATSGAYNGYISPAISIHAPRGGSDAASSSASSSTGDFNPRSPWGERRQTTQRSRAMYHFNPRSPWGERQEERGIMEESAPISIHAPRGGSDFLSGKSSRPRLKFQSTLPVGGATAACRRFQRDATISIHAPRGGSDVIKVQKILSCKNFNPRSPWGERLSRSPCQYCIPPFQSTLPVGGATRTYFLGSGGAYISLHAPRGGSDLPQCLLLCNIFLFQSTLPVGGATNCNPHQAKSPAISIHAPRGGSDQQINLAQQLTIRISIHAPRGGSDSKDAQFYLCIFGEKVNFECNFLVNSRCQPVP